MPAIGIAANITSHHRFPAPRLLIWTLNATAPGSSVYASHNSHLDVPKDCQSGALASAKPPSFPLPECGPRQSPQPPPPPRLAGPVLGLVTEDYIKPAPPRLTPPPRPAPRPPWAVWSLTTLQPPSPITGAQLLKPDKNINYTNLVYCLLFIVYWFKNSHRPEPTYSCSQNSHTHQTHTHTHSYIDT